VKTVKWLYGKTIKFALNRTFKHDDDD